MELKGKIKSKLPIESGTSKAGKEWKKQTVVIDNGDQYNPDTAVSFFGEDKVNILSKFSEGQDVSISVNIYSREFGGKYYNQIDGWKINATNEAPQADPVDEMFPEF